jgi:hypothetical protein
MRQYLWLVFVLILVYIVIRHSDAFKRVINSLSAGFMGQVVALQGGNPGQFVN